MKSVERVKKKEVLIKDKRYIRNNSPWSKRKIDLLKTLWPRHRQGEFNCGDISMIFKASWVTLRRKAMELGIDSEPQNDIIDEEYLKKIGFDI